MASFLSWFGVVFLTPTLPEVGGHFKFQLNLGHPPPYLIKDSEDLAVCPRAMTSIVTPKENAPRCIVALWTSFLFNRFSCFFDLIYVLLHLRYSI